MAYDERLAERVREVLQHKVGLTERHMFGGIAFMLHGHMFVGVSGRSLMARVGPENDERALKRAGVREMDFTGRPMRGYVFVEGPALRSAADLKGWVEMCAAFVATLPPKDGQAASRRPRRRTGAINGRVSAAGQSRRRRTRIR